MSEELQRDEENSSTEQREVIERDEPKTASVSTSDNFGRPKCDAHISVYNFVLKEEKLGKYTVYSIRGTDKDGDFETQRRYSDFDKIRSVLVNRWPGVYIPPLPPKKTIHNLEVKFLEERRRALDDFCKMISAASYLHYSEEFQLFIRSTSDLDKLLQAFQKIDYEDLLTKYTAAFSYLTEKELTSQSILKITGFKMFLTKVRASFDNFKKISKSLATAKRSYYERLGAFHNLACVQYEKSIFSEYHSNPTGNVFSSSEPVQTEAAEKLKEVATRDSIEHINDWMEQEAREIDAFIDALNQKDKYDQLKNKSQNKQKSESEDLQKVLAGKKTLKTLFSTKPKEEKILNIEKNIAATSRNMEALNALNDIIAVRLAYDEIDRFKKSKVEGYYKMLYLSSGNELLNSHGVADYWESILANENIKPLLAE